MLNKQELEDLPICWNTTHSSEQDCSTEIHTKKTSMLQENTDLFIFFY